MTSPAECGPGTGPGTCCPLWQCYCAFQMLCGKVVLGKQGDDRRGSALHYLVWHLAPLSILSADELWL